MQAINSLFKRLLPYANKHVALLVLFIGLVFNAIPGIDYGTRIPGDLGDNRLNNLILEHLYRFVSGQGSLWEMNFFYGFPNVLAFSSNHIGAFIFYGIPRFFGFDYAHSFQIWYVCSFIFNYMAAYYSLRKLGYLRVSSALGAYIFSFSLVIYFQQGHAQLLYRFFVPLAVSYLFVFFERREIYFLLISLSMLFFQFAIEIYTGYFLFLFMILMCFNYVLICLIKLNKCELRRVYCNVDNRHMRFAIVLLCISSVLLFYIAYNYYEVVKLYGFSRSGNEILDLLPRFKSYFLSDHSLIYNIENPWISGYFSDLALPWEHQLFIGISLFVIAIYSVVTIVSRNKVDMRPLISILSLVSIFFITLYTGSNSIYLYISQLPGVNAIRGVGRYILVGLFFFSVLGSSLTDRISKSFNGYGTTKFLLIALMFLFVFIESTLVKQPGFTLNENYERISTLQKKVPKTQDNSVLVFKVDNENIPDKIDVMWVANNLNLKTLNGYSGNVPPVDFNLVSECKEIPKLLSKLVDSPIYNGPSYNDLLNRIVPVGYDDCDFKQISTIPKSILVDKKYTPDELKNIQTNIDDVTLSKNKILISATIINNSSVTLPAYLPIGKELKASAKLVSVDGVDYYGFHIRKEINYDLQPYSENKIKTWIPKPTVPGEYFVDFDIVQEGNIWRGSVAQPSRFNHVIRVD